MIGWIALRQRATILAFGLGLAAALSGSPGYGAEATLPLAQDLARDAREAAANGRALIVLYTLPGCPWCARLRREYLGPMVADPAEQHRASIREIDITSTAALVAPDGTKTTHRDFAAARGIRFTPTTAFLAADGAAAAESIVGYPPGGFYGAYLEQRIDESRALAKKR